ncbi:MAG: hypothetical protein WD810_07855 [Solirubrobacterales bacterium]
MSAPARAPVVCGAIGSFDPERMRRLAGLLGDAPRTVHEDDSSILMLDREPIEWNGRRQRGLGWIEGEIWRARPDVVDWRGAARCGATGLVLEGRRRFLHSAVNGLAPLYWIEDRGTTYFSSRIDPLVRSSPDLLSIDWDAWAAIIALRYPLGDRTPFAEVRRLPPFSTLRRRLGAARPRAHTSPWEQIEPGAGLAGAADAAVEGLREALSPIGRSVICPLSGGRDSRMLFSALAAEGRVERAVTVSDDEGETIEEDLAAAVAAAFGVTHERLSGSPASYPQDWHERAMRVEYQFVDHAWLVPVARRVEGLRTPVPDGFAIDVFVQSERHFNPPGALEHRRREGASLTLFEALRRYGLAHRALADDLHDPVVSRAREQFLAATRRFRGHPSQNLLSTYATRSVRGVATYPTGLLGREARVLTPGASDAVVSAALSATQLEKDGGALYRAIFERLDPMAGRLPSTTDTPRSGPRLERRWRSQPALDAHRRLLAEGPLAEHLSPQLRAWLAAPDGVELSGDLRLGMEAVSLLHAWWRRYRDCLREVDASELSG